MEDISPILTPSDFREWASNALDPFGMQEEEAQAILTAVERNNWFVGYDDDDNFYFGETAEVGNIGGKLFSAFLSRVIKYYQGLRNGGTATREDQLYLALLRRYLEVESFY